MTGVTENDVLNGSGGASCILSYQFAGCVLVYTPCGNSPCPVMHSQTFKFYLAFSLRLISIKYEDFPQKSGLNPKVVWSSCFVTLPSLVS